MSSIRDPFEPQQVPFLRQLSAQDAEALLQQLRPRMVPKASPVLRAGSAGEDVIVVLKGRVKLAAAGAGGREVVLAIRGPGELLGEMAVLGGIRRTATGVAVDKVEVGIIGGDHFRAFLAEADRDRSDLATHDSIGRVAKRLLELAPITECRPRSGGVSICRSARTSSRAGPAPPARRFRARCA